MADSLEARVKDLERRLTALERRKPLAACKRCKGSGKQPGLHNLCGRCGGSGIER